jgi:uncharacterized protein
MEENSKKSWWKNPRELLRQILLLNDSEHSVAVGTTVGVFVGMTPTVGVQMLMIIIFAFITKPFFHFNRIAALVSVYISNPLTMLPIYWFDYKVGTYFVEGNMTKEEFSKILEYNSFSEWWNTVLGLFIDVGWPLFWGAMVLATLASLITYPAMRYLLNSFHKKEACSHNPDSDN